MYMVKINARSIQRLIDLTLWCMGRDIECDGNLLLLFGFIRYRPPKPNMGSSRYHILFEGCKVILWGFGMLIRQCEISIFINRHRYSPKILEVGDQADTIISNIWSLSDLSMLREPACYEYDVVRRLLLTLFKLLYRYESWIHVVKGREYRAYCMNTFGTDYSIDDMLALLRSLACEESPIILHN